MSDNLDATTRDQLVALTRGAANAIPFIGGFLGELITEVIPGQRQERIIIYIRELAKRIDAMEADAAKAALANPEKIDLVERGGYQAIRAISEDRIKRIAELVANGLKRDETSLVRRKRLLRLLGEVDDDELAILTAYGLSYGSGDRSHWEKIDVPDPPTFGSDRSDVESSKLYDAGKDNLLRLGLLRKSYNSVRRGELPEFDPSTGAFKGTWEISYLGRMLLREVGIELPFDG